MISAILGTPGQGKSLTGSKLIKDLLNQGINVYTNLHVNDPRTNYFYFPTEKHNVIYSLQDGVIIFDEGQFLLDARNWEKLPVEFRVLLQKGRHEGLDFIILTQNINQIDVSARRLLHEASMIMRILTIKKLNIGLFLQFDVETMNIEKQVTHGLPTIIFADKEDFEYYNSYALRTKKTLPQHKQCSNFECKYNHEIDYKTILTNVNT